MYGLKNNYFNSENTNFHNSIWIELIGFDKNDIKGSVSEYFKTTGFIPHSISFHLTSINFVNTHKGMQSEYILPDYACSYAGHLDNKSSTSVFDFLSKRFALAFLVQHYLGKLARFVR